MNITPVECSRTIINLLYFSHPPKHTFLSGQAHLPYIDINSHSPKHTFLSGRAHLPYIDINSHSPKHTFLSGQAHLPYIDTSSHTSKHTFLFGWAHLPYIDITSHCPQHTFLAKHTFWQKSESGKGNPYLLFGYSLLSDHDLSTTHTCPVTFPSPRCLP